jgi:hypothetical protein
MVELGTVWAMVDAEWSYPCRIRLGEAEPEPNQFRDPCRAAYAIYARERATYRAWVEQLGEM